VWWACSCNRQANAAGGGPAGAALAAAEAWVGTQSEEHRRAAEKSVEAAGAGTPAGCTALAAFLSGGSLAPPGVQEVPASPTLTPAAVAGAVALAAVAGDASKAADRFRKFLALAHEVAVGKNRWPTK
jgi:hypothetical protein